MKRFITTLVLLFMATLAMAQDVEIKAVSPYVGNCYPFGNNTYWVNYSGFVYKNVPGFNMNVGDKISFDLGRTNNIDITRDIYFARTTTNGGNTITSWVKVVDSSQTPENPRGNSVIGDFELTFTAEAPYSFPGGGFAIAFGPGPSSDSDCEQVLVGTTSNDASNKFVGRFYSLNALASNQTINLNTSSIGGFKISAGNLDTEPPTVVTQDITVELDANGNASITPQDVDNGSSDDSGNVDLSLDRTDFDCNDLLGNSLSFDGDNDNVRLSTPLNIGQGNSTVEAWVKVPKIGEGGLSDGERVGIILGNYSSPNNINYEIHARGQVRFYWNNGQANTLGTKDLRDGKWHHLAFVRIAAESRFIAYIDGEEEFNVVKPSSQVTFSSTHRIGGDNRGNPPNFHGNIDEVRIWNYARTQAEIESEMLDALKGIESGLINYWNFEEGAGSSVTDLASGNTGTLNLMDASSDWEDGAPNNILIPVELTASDASNNSNSVTALVRVKDVLAPVITPSDITITLDAQGSASISVADMESMITDNCEIACIELSQTDFDCDNLGTNTVSLTVMDNSFNTTFTDITVIVNDEIAPTVVGKPIEVTLTASGTVSITAQDVLDSGSDNCGPLTYSLNQDTFGATDALNSPVTVQLTGTDPSGNATTVDVLVTVIDPVPTVITQDITVYLDANGSVTIAPEDVDNGSSSVVGLSGLSLDITVFGCNNVGENTVTLTATSTLGSSASETAIVTVVDNILPTVLTQNLTVDLSNGGVSIAPDQVNNGSYDNCEIASITLDREFFTCEDLGDNTVTLTVTDVNGNSASATAIITVRDVTMPYLNVINRTFGLDENGLLTITPNTMYNSSNDDCGGPVVVTIDKESFDCTNLGDNVITVTSTDESGNQNIQQAILTIVDAAEPEVHVKEIHTVYLDESGQATLNFEDIDTGTLDNCGIDHVEISRTTFTCDDIGSVVVTTRAYDVNGNMDVNAGQTVIIVEDPIATTVLTKNITIDLDANGNASITPEMIDNGTYDNCSFVLSLSKSTFDCSNVGDNTVRLIATSNSGFSGAVEEATAIVTVRDVTAAEVVTQDITVELDVSGNASITTGMIDNGSNDACGIASYALDVTTFDCSDVGANTVTLTVTDNNGQVSTGTATVTVEDNIAAEVITQNITVDLDANGSASITSSDIDNGSNDACGIASYELDITNFDCSNTGDNTVTLTVTDVNGNVSSNTATVTVIDVIAPTVITKDITVQLDANGEATITPASVDDGSYDNCTFSLGLDKTSFDCLNVGTNTVTLTATDASGNQSSATATVTVEDTILPTIVPNHIDVYLDESGNASITVADVDGGTYDNCGVATLTIDITSFGCEDLGENTVILTATDVNGNLNTGTATVTVIDNIAPTVNANDITLELDENGQASFTAEDVLIYSEDDIERDTECDVTDGNGHGMYLKKYVQGESTVSDPAMGLNNSNSLDNSQGTSKSLWGSWISKWKNKGGNHDDDDDDDGKGKGKGKNKVKPKDTRFTFTSSGTLTKSLDGTASVTGTLQSTEDATDQWTVTLNLGQAYNWEEWKDMGKTYKGEWWQVWDSYKDWTYYELQSGTLTGAGRNAGETVTITNAHKNFGFQMGEGANLMNSNYGMAGWIDYTNRKGDEESGDFAMDIDNCGLVAVPEGTVYTDDNCSIAATSVDVGDFTCTQLGENTVNVSVTDQSGNTTTVPVTVTVNDHIAPVAVATNITVSLGADGTVTVDPAELDGGSTDNTDCDLTYTLSENFFDCDDIGKGSYYYDDHDCDDDRHWNKKGKGHYSHKGYGYGHYKHKKGKKHRGHKVTLTVTDAAGNSSSTTAYIEVVDDAAPVINEGPVDLVVYNEVKTYKKKVKKGRRWKWVTYTKVDEKYEYLKDDDIEPMVNDNCGVKDIYFNKTRYGVEDAGLNQVQVTARDYYGNQSTGTINVNVIDITDLGQYVDMCYDGRTLQVKQSKVQDMLRKGASLGNCNGNTNMAASDFTLGEPVTEEIFVPELSLESYPNPTSGMTTIRIRSNVSGPARVALVSTSGIELEELYSAELEAHTEVEVGYDASPLPSGVYIVRLVTAGEVRNLKLMVKK